MLECFSGAYPPGLLYQQFGEELFGAAADVRPMQALGVVATLHRSFEYLLVEHTVERQLPRQHVIHDDSYAEHVHPLVVVLLLHNFGSGVVGRPHILLFRANAR